MKQEEKYIRDQLKDYDSPLDIDSGWAALDQALGQEEEKPKAIWLKFLPLIALLLIAFIYVLNKNYNLPSATTENTVIENQGDKNSDLVTKSSQLENTISSSENKDDHAKSKELLEETKETNLITTDLIPSEQTKNQEAIQNSLNNQSLSASSKSTQKNSKSTTAQNSKSQQSSIKKAVAIQNPTTAPATNITEAEDLKNIVIPVLKLSEPSISKLKAAITNLKYIPGIRSLLSYLRVTPEIKDIKPLDKPIKPISKKTPWMVSLGTGVNYSFFNEKILTTPSISSTISDISSDWLSKKMDAESSTSNLNLNLRLKRRLNNKWSFSTGIQYINHGVLFNVNDTLVLQGITSDFGTRLQTNISEELLDLNISNQISQGSLVCRKFQSYNQLKSLQLPLLVGYSIAKEALELNFNMGLSLNYILSSSGSNFEFRDSERIIEFLYLEESVYKQSSLITGALAEVELSYNLNNQFGLFASAGGGMLLGNLASNKELFEAESAFNNIFESKLNYLNFNVGLSYNF